MSQQVFEKLLHGATSRGQLHFTSSFYECIVCSNKLCLLLIYF